MAGRSSGDTVLPRLDVRAAVVRQRTGVNPRALDPLRPTAGEPLDFLLPVRLPRCVVAGGGAGVAGGGAYPHSREPVEYRPWNRPLGDRRRHHRARVIGDPPQLGELGEVRLILVLQLLSRSQDDAGGRFRASDGRSDQALPGTGRRRHQPEAPPGLYDSLDGLQLARAPLGEPCERWARDGGGHQLCPFARSASMKSGVGVLMCELCGIL